MKKTMVIVFLSLFAVVTFFAIATVEQPKELMYRWQSV